MDGIEILALHSTVSDLGVGARVRVDGREYETIIDTQNRIVEVYEDTSYLCSIPYGRGRVDLAAAIRRVVAD